LRALYAKTTGTTFALRFRSEAATVFTVLFEGRGHPA
jgi:hypothetical protein